ncbi:hypothetical protein JYJ95_42205 [Corallococcus exiguus]|uniref:hypothetical protein n=1 Tax=Corallococcus exiguus TaxID=83462 RepID=UPI001A8D6931|nr:hypothetical protein [Corallococcus exiguus]MBN8473156.1 hypothetical protein [Corallococcus exiguus]
MAVTVVLGARSGVPRSASVSSLAPSVSEAQTSRAVFAALHQDVGDAVALAAGEAGDAGRAGGRSSRRGSRRSARFRTWMCPKVEALQGAFTRYWQEAVAGGGAGGAQ